MPLTRGMEKEYQEKIATLTAEKEELTEQMQHIATEGKRTVPELYTNSWQNCSFKLRKLKRSGDKKARLLSRSDNCAMRIKSSRGECMRRKSLSVCKKNKLPSCMTVCKI